MMAKMSFAWTLIMMSILILVKGKNITLSTLCRTSKDLTQYGISVEDRTSIVFLIKGEDYAIVKLKAAHYEVEVTIRNENYSIIKGTGSTSTVNYTKTRMTLLNETEFRWLWIAWKKGIQLGKGEEVGKYVVVDLNTDTVPATFETIEISCSQTEIQWIFNNDTVDAPPATAISNTAPLDQVCECPCYPIVAEKKNYTVEELRDLLDELRSALTVNRKETSTSKRKLISAPDKRVSSQGIGFIGIFIITCAIGGIVMMDLPRCIAFVRSLKP